MSGVIFSRKFAMPSADTFSIAPIAALLDRWVPKGGGVVVDPFARNSRHGTVRNDLNPACDTEYHMDAVEFSALIRDEGIRAQAVLFDPPYSPRQIAEVYKSVGRAVGTKDTQNAALYAAVRDALAAVLVPGGVALSFGWNTNGFGLGRGFAVEEILLVNHGGAHNDTLCVVERKSAQGELYEANQVGARVTPAPLAGGGGSK